MERYYFNDQDGVCIADKDGTLLESVEHAKTVALQHMLDRLRGKPELFWDHEAFSVIVQDSQKLSLFTLDLTASMSPAMRTPKPKT